MKLLNFFRDLFSTHEEVITPKKSQDGREVITPKKYQDGGEVKKPKQRVSRLNTKHFKVKNHLLKNGTINSWTAIELYGATRLSAIIYNLRGEGMLIESIPCTSYDRNSEICNYTTYKLVQEDENN